MASTCSGSSTLSSPSSFRITLDQQTGLARPSRRLHYPRSVAHQALALAPASPAAAESPLFSVEDASLFATRNRSATVRLRRRVVLPHLHPLQASETSSRHRSPLSAMSAGCRILLRMSHARRLNKTLRPAPPALFSTARPVTARVALPSASLAFRQIPSSTAYPFKPLPSPARPGRKQPPATAPASERMA